MSSHMAQLIIEYRKRSKRGRCIHAVEGKGSHPGGRRSAPKIFYETGVVVKEPVSVIVGRDPLESVGQIFTIVKLYRDRR